MAQIPEPNPAGLDAIRALEEENRALRERLESGPLEAAELKLMRLAETLRQENQRLAAEVEGLGTKNIELVFQVEESEENLREVRKAHVEIQEELERVRTQAEERSRLLEASSQEAALTAQARLTEMEGLLAESRNRHEALDQELASLHRELEEERTRREQAEAEVARLRVEGEDRSRRVEELEARVAEAEGRAGSLETRLEEASQEKARIQAEEEASRTRVESLEKTLREFREQFLQKVEEPRRAARLPEDSPAAPDRALARLMESLLGSTGPVLVQRVYARCGIEPGSRDPRAHLQVLASLEETSSRLIPTSEKRERLGQELERLRTVLSGLAEASEPVPEPVAAPEPGTPAPEAESPEPEVLAAQAAAEEAGPEPGTPAPEVESPEPEVLAAQADAGEGAVPAPVPSRHLRPEEDAVAFRRASDPALCARIEEGMKLVGLEKYDNAWDLFQELAQAHPEVLEIQEGLFYNYFGSFCFNEALEIGRRILAAELESPGAERFVKAMHTVLIERLKAVRDSAERKRLFLNLAEIHLDDPPQALDFLARARQIPGRGPTDARLHYYRLRLQTGDPAEQLQDVLGALEGLADHGELFEDLDRVSAQERNRIVRPAARVVLALVHEGRQKAATAEKEAGERVAPIDPDPALVEQEHDDAADQIVEFLLNRLLPRGQVEISFPDPAFSALLADSKPAPVGWKPAEFLERLAWRLFHLKNVRAHLYSGEEPFWCQAVPEPTPQVLFHPEVAGLPAAEQQGLVLRALFHLHHRHVHLQRAAELLDNPMRCRLLGLTRDVVQETGTDVSDSLEREIDSLDPERPDLEHEMDRLLGRIHDHCLREEFLILRDFFKPGRLFRVRLEGSADRFVSRLVGLTAASYGIARTELGRTPLFEEIEKTGFGALYRHPLETWRTQRSRLQRLWISALR